MSNQPVRIVSRSLLLAWCVWLLVSLLIHHALDAPSAHWLPTTDSLVPMGRWMLTSMMIGLAVMWPLWRLSRDAEPFALARIVADAVCLLALAQVVVGCLSIDAYMRWSPVQLLLVDLTLTAWTALTAFCVWLGYRRAGVGRRAVAMAACILLVIGGPVCAAWTGWAFAARCSPLPTLWQLSERLSYGQSSVIAGQLATVGVIAAVLWTAAFVTRRTRLSDNQKNQ